eukprot:c26247_g1_i1 orf=254-1513(+)
MTELEQPLLSSIPTSTLFDDLRAAPAPQDREGKLSEWAQCEYVNESLQTPAAVEADSAVNGTEIRAAASQDPYPGQSAQPGGQSQVEGQNSMQVLEEEEIREILLDHVGHHCCWGGQPARKWRIQKVENCNSYLGTLETFIEKRDVLEEVEPYTGGNIDSRDNGRVPGIWEVDMRSEFPLLFVSRKEVCAKLPHSEAVEKCRDCSGQGKVACPSCNPHPELGHYVPGVTTICSDCHGRGLIAHYDGSDTHCVKCKGFGRLPCSNCSSQGLVKCQMCHGEGVLLKRKIIRVRWQTLLNRKVSTSRSAASVPDEVFHRAKGVRLYHSQCYQCEPASFPKVSGLSKFSSDIIAERAPIPPAARVICERHQIIFVPVARVDMGRGDRSFRFYIIGLSREVFLKDYPAKWCCGLCYSGGMCNIC